jgi:mono/diheme cytochrome c family protein
MARQVFLAWILVLLLSVGLTRAQTGKAPSSAPSPVDGAEIYHRYCASCHGADGRGHGPASAKLKGGAPDLTRLKRSNSGIFPDEYVRNVIEGSLTRVRADRNRQMPAWEPVFHRVEWDQDFGEIRLEAITNYVASIQR